MTTTTTTTRPRAAAVWLAAALLLVGVLTGLRVLTVDAEPRSFAPVAGDPGGVARQGEAGAGGREIGDVAADDGGADDGGADDGRRSVIPAEACGESVFGRARDGEGRSVAGVTVRADWRRETDLPWQSDELIHLGKAVTDAAGRYRIALPERLAGEEIGAGQLLVEFDPPWRGWSAEEQGWFESAADGRRYARVDGEVLRDDQMRFIDVEVRTVDGDLVPMAEIDYHDDQHWIITEARGDGSERIDVPAGDDVAWVQAWHPDHGRSRLVRQPFGQIELVLGDTRDVLAGQVRFEDGRPANDLHMSWSWADGDLRIDSLADHVTECEIVSGAGGWFEVHGVLAGEWSLFQELLEPPTAAELHGDEVEDGTGENAPSPSDLLHPVPGPSIELVLRYTRVRVLGPSGGELPPGSYLHLKRWTPFEARRLGLWPQPPAAREVSGDEDQATEMDTVAEHLGRRHELWLRPGGVVRWELQDERSEEPLAAGWFAAPLGPSTDLQIRLPDRRGD